MALDRKAAQDTPYRRVDGPRVDSDAGVGGNLEPGRVTGNKQQVMQPKSLFNANCEANEVVHVGSPLSRLYDGVISNGPREHAGRVSHANASEEMA
eukprot:11218974-Lingulodinium_polyedra.AAC.1